MNYLLVFIGGGIGSMMRYGVSKLFPRSLSEFPLATLVSNLTACMLFVAFVYYGAKGMKEEWLTPFLIVGLCGGFSTFSTFSFENFALYQQGNYGFLMVNVLISILPGMFCFYLISDKM